MKRLIGCPAGEWAKKLFTLDRFEKIDYFIDEDETKCGYEWMNKEVHPYDYLRKENKDEILIIITDTRQYKTIRAKLLEYGLEENVHFFNGWKLDINFYKILFADKNWINFERENTRALSERRAGWEKRAEIMAQMIPGDVRSLLDIGCGEKLLKKFLPDNISYYGLDYCRRDEETIVCDINREYLPDFGVDLYYMAGVIDYVEDVSKFVQQFGRARYVLVSKVRNERFIRLDDKVMDEGYLNYGIDAYYVSNLISDMYIAGFVCSKMLWNYKDRDEYYLLFENIR